jgi:hypothetical protein
MPQVPFPKATYDIESMHSALAAALTQYRGR